MSSSSYNPHDVARASLQHLTELSRRANQPDIPAPLAPPQQPPSATSRLNALLPRLQTSPDLTGLSTPSSQQLTSPPQHSILQGPPVPLPNMQPPLDWSNHQGLQVLTVGHLLPRSTNTASTSPTEDMEVVEQVMPSASYQNPGPSTSTSGGARSSNNRLRVRRKTYVPGWAVPPRVLLVEDDAVSRKLSSKFLQVLGVTADIAVDGDAAVKQMCLERYDLVLMVRLPLFLVTPS